MNPHLWSKPYCGVSHFAGPRVGPGRIQISVTDRVEFAEVHRLNLDAESRAAEVLPARPGGVFTATHEALRKTVDEAKAVGEAWAKGHFSAPRMPEGGL